MWLAWSQRENWKQRLNPKVWKSWATDVEEMGREFYFHDRSPDNGYLLGIWQGALSWVETPPLLSFLSSLCNWVWNGVKIPSWVSLYLSIPTLSMWFWISLFARRQEVRGIVWWRRMIYEINNLSLEGKKDDVWRQLAKTRLFRSLSLPFSLPLV